MGKIKYRPHRGTLRESIKEMKTFDTVDAMLDYIVSNSDMLFSKENLSISKNYGHDTRIDWKENRHIRTTMYGNILFKEPQCIGMCSFEN